MGQELMDNASALTTANNPDASVGGHMDNAAR